MRKSEKQSILIPPHSTMIEARVLGIMLLISDSILDVIPKINSQAIFYSDFYQKVYDCIEFLYNHNRPVDLISVISLFQSKYPDEQKAAYEITRLTNEVTSSSAISQHVLHLLELHMKRSAIKLGQQLLAKAYSSETDAFDLLQEANDGLLKIQEGVTSGKEIDITSLVMKVKENRMKVLENGMVGLDTGFSEVNEVLSGWVAPDLVIIAARPGAGKTALALSTLKTVAINNKQPVAIFSLEMSGEQLVERLESIQSEIFHKKLRYNDLSGIDHTFLNAAEHKICNSPIYIDDKPAINIRYIRSKATILKRKHGIKLIIIDYLQLMSGVDERGKNREQIISEISRGLKEIAKELNVPVIALSQLSRAVEARPDKIPQLSDLRESGAIEQDADEVIFLMRPEYYGFTEPIEIDDKSHPVQGLVLCKIAKNRHGVTKSVPLRFRGDLMKFTDYEARTSFAKEVANGYMAVDEESNELPF